jgi:hypothetical protein
MKKIFSKKNRTLFFAALIALAVFLCRNISARAESSVALRIAPLSYDFQLEPGEQRGGKILVENVSDDEVQIAVEYSDFFIDDSGKYIFSDDREIANDELKKYSLKNWLTVDSDKFVLEKKTSREIDFSLKVPTDATLGGHYGVIFFRTQCQNEKDKNVVSTDKSSVCVSGRVGTLLLAAVGGSPNREGKIEKINLQKFSSEDQVPFGVEIKNTGNTHFKPEGEVRVKNIFGQNVSKFEISGKTLLPATSRNFQSEIDRQDLVGIYSVSGEIRDGNGRVMNFKKFVFMPPWKEGIAALLAATLFFWIAKKFRIQKKKQKEKSVQKKVFEKKENDLTKTDSEK